MKKNLKAMITTLLITTLCSVNVLSFANSNTKDEALVTDNHNNKMFVTIGDSITARDRQTYGEVKEPYIGYQQHIKRELGMDSYVNLGISGATIARGSEYLRGITKIANDFTFGDAEFIIVFAGTNDFKLGTPLGNKSDLTKAQLDRYNFYGAYAGLVKDLKRNNPGADIYLFTPTKRDCKEFEGVCRNKSGNYLVEFVKATIDVAKEFDVHVVDMYGIKEMKQSNLGNYTVDGLHLNNRGYEVVAKKFIEEYRARNK